MSFLDISGNLKRIWFFANRAAGNNPKKISPIHLLYACSLTTDSLACALLNSEGITSERIAANPSAFFADKTVDEIFSLAETQSVIMNHPEIYSEDLLYVLCTSCKQTKSVIDKINSGASRRILHKIANNITSLENVVERPVVTQSSIVKNETQKVGNTMINPNQGFTNVKSSKNCTELSSLLLTYGQDLTAKAQQGKIDRIIGREDETNRLIEILCRKTKNNPVLIGEAGVG